MSEQRALLLTDVVDSTQLAERLGDAAAAELSAAHDRVARDLLRAWHGREIDKTDGMLMLFDTAADAVGCVRAYHAALAALPVPLKARAGLHFGPVILRANPAQDVAHGAKPLEVEGIAKPMAARVMSLAMGGQTLLTAEARAALGDTALRVQSHGFWRIKGISEPVELFEIGDEHAPFEPPPDSAKVYRVVQRGELWLPLREVVHGLPAERDAFVGRQEALSDLARRFGRGGRLVSVLGVGGTGKTRLATRFAWTWLGDFPGGAWFCDLSGARNADGIVQAVAQAMGVPLGAGDPVQQLGHAIAGRGACLLVLDNFEQVARHAAQTLGRWLDRAPEARFLVTTREVLGLPGEEALALAPLVADEGVALFMRRASAAHGGFAPSDTDRAAISKLVTLLDGLPLAIELAAARVRVMSPSLLLSRMDQRFRLLVAAGGRHDRQATLRAAFDWSWDLLSRAEKSALAQLSVFEGGFTLPAAEAVVELSAGDGRHWMVDVLQSLIDKSLVRPVGESRFDLLVSVKEYAAEHLRAEQRFADSGVAAEQRAQDRHGLYFADAARSDGSGASPVELENLAVACRRAVRGAQGRIAVATLSAAWSVLKHVGPFETGCELARSVAQMPGLDLAGRAGVGHIEGCALEALGQVHAAKERLDQALQDARRAEDESITARVLNSLGALHANQGKLDDARSCHAQALAIARRLADCAEECASLNGLGAVCVDLGLVHEAREHFEAALQAARNAGDRRWECGILGNLGGASFNLGDADAAESQFAQALVIAREIGSRIWEGSALCNLGALHHARAGLEAALAESEAALSLARSIGHLRLECVARCNLGLVSFARQAFGEAENHYRLALDLARQLNDQRSEGLFLGYLGQVQAQLGQFDEARGSLRDGERLLRQVDDRFSLGVLLCHRVEAEHLAGSHDAAHAAHCLAGEIATDLSAQGDSELGQALARAAALLARPGTSATSAALR
jgi:predicted ATPase/class 3 adenylate cyclase